MGKLKKAAYIFDLVKNAFHDSNKVVLGIGLSILTACIVCKFILPKSIKKGKVTKWIYRGAWIVSILLILISLSVGMGKGIGIGNGSGAGIGNGAGIGTGDSSGIGNEGTELNNTVTIVNGGSIVIKIHKTEIYIGDMPCDDEEQLVQALRENFKPEYTIVLLDDYADNDTYELVLHALKNEGYNEEKIKPERTD